MVGQGIRVLATLALPEENRDEQTIGRVQGDLDRYLREHPVMKSKPYPEVPALLSRLQERIIPMSILTNKPDSLARAVVAQLLDGWSFKGIQGQREDVPRKPDPTAAISLSDVMGVAPTQIVFVGDSDIDMQTALAAGMTPVGVAWGFRGRVELDAAGAKRIISRPLDLLELFERR
jgi:phosphoglycolate phosphatase